MKNNITPIMTKRLSLTPVNESHSNDFFKMQLDPNMYEFVEEGALSLEEITKQASEMEKRVSPANPDMIWWNWLVYNLQGEAIGKIDIAIFSLRDILMSYMFNSEFWQKGYAFEATTSVIDFVREQNIGVEFLELEIDHLNVASLALASKLGFRKVGINRNVGMINGRRSDDIVLHLRL